MDNKILSLKEKFVSELDKIDNLADIESIRVSYLGKKGSVTDLLKGMKELSNDERKAFGQKVNELKGLVNEKITEKTNELKEKEIQKEIDERFRKLKEKSVSINIKMWYTKVW